ncbi:DnaJ C-terminal domain-containing protein [Pleomorphomonas sp. JP5]|uniref:DnaJ C-terminal domain-containing protein n=1 Tax=Pleomorphomonas sp. JP5 TaxID=2942998 RepID=UPI002043AE89|nr:DnaJ C-terminal domain-containing protein [Pleomorphomonas sp. JP5]MCM5558704.1 DnaJ domain-containing protein [Pleomorphomonas sp. JP5]
MRDPYEVLGVPRSADENTIKKAYRKLAKQHHPDANKNDPRSKERFAELNSAYEIVGDKDKRRQFDAGEIDADGKPRFTGFEGFGGASGAGGGFRHAGGRATDDILHDIFGDAFNSFASGGARGARGGRRGGGFSGFEGFSGAGAAGPGAGASGSTKGADVMVTARVRLEDIVGSGKVRVTLPNGKSLDAKIPAGFEPGQQLRLKGQGGEGTPPGDAIAILVYETHALFRPDGYNLRLDLPVTLDEAVLGGKVRVPTLEGAVDMTIPAGVTGSKAFRLRGKGLPDKKGVRGDIFVTPRIVLPDGADAGLEKLMERWREVRPYDVRGPEFSS